MYQQRYWNQLKEFRTHVIYLSLYAANSEWWNKTINMFLAITSSASIAAWAVWQEQQMFWAAIIALSQVVTAIKPFLPYQQRLKAIGELNDSIQSLALECEKCWYAVAEGQLDEEQIHNKYIELREKALKAEKKSLGSLVLPKKKSILQEAETEADIYLSKNYSGA